MIGLVITVAILLVLRDAAREVYRRLMDAVEPVLVLLVLRDAAREVYRRLMDAVEPVGGSGRACHRFRFPGSWP